MFGLLTKGNAMQAGDRVRFQVQATIEFGGLVMGASDNGIVVKANSTAAMLPGTFGLTTQQKEWAKAAGVADLEGRLLWIGAADVIPPKVVLLDIIE
jgi:hypothetical protein